MNLRRDMRREQVHATSSTARFVESVHFFLVILVILLTAEPVRILKMEVPQVSNFESFTAEPLNFHYC